MELFVTKLTLLWKDENIGQSSSQLRRTNSLHLPITLANPGGQSFERVTALRQFERRIETILAPKLKMERVAFWSSGCFILDVFGGGR